MLSGTANLADLVPGAPTIGSTDIEPLTLEGVEVLQLQYELAASQIENLFPPALHPTIPPLGQWIVWHADTSPWGKFTLVQFRISCRSGSRPRAFVLRAVIDNAEAKAQLSANWGLPLELRDIEFQRGYEVASFKVCDERGITLELDAKDPDPLEAKDIQFFASMHAAHLPNGLRLVQFDPTYVVHRAERYVPQLNEFNATAWGSTQINPDYAVIGYGVNAAITLPRLRFACRPNESAFSGTELIG